VSLASFLFLFVWLTLILYKRRLDPLREENDSDLISKSESELGNEEDKLPMVPYLSDNLVKSLIEQARNEGIYTLAESDTNRDSSDTGMFNFLAIGLFMHRKLFFSKQY
jgi:hypothetical protein